MGFVLFGVTVNVLQNYTGIITVVHAILIKTINYMTTMMPSALQIVTGRSAPQKNTFLRVKFSQPVKSNVLVCLLRKNYV